MEHEDGCDICGVRYHAANSASHLNGKKHKKNVSDLTDGLLYQEGAKTFAQIEECYFTRYGRNVNIGEAAFINEIPTIAKLYGLYCLKEQECILCGEQKNMREFSANQIWTKGALVKCRKCTKRLQNPSRQSQMDTMRGSNTQDETQRAVNQKGPHYGGGTGGPEPGRGEPCPGRGGPGPGGGGSGPGGGGAPSLGPPGSNHRSPGPMQSQNICKTPGCYLKSIIRPSDGFDFGYCSKQHRDETQALKTKRQVVASETQPSPQHKMPTRIQHKSHPKPPKSQGKVRSQAQMPIQPLISHDKDSGSDGELEWLKSERMKLAKELGKINGGERERDLDPQPGAVSDSPTKVDVLDSANRWSSCDVLKVRARGNELYVSYDGWSDKWDEWVDATGERVAQHLTKSRGRGKLVDAQDVRKRWYASEIIDTNGSKVLISYSGWSSKYDEWVDTWSERLSVLGTHSMRVGQTIDAKDTAGKWYISTILQTLGDNMEIHYNGFDDKWDEWIAFNSDRIAPLHSNTKGSQHLQKQSRNMDDMRRNNPQDEIQMAVNQKPQAHELKVKRQVVALKPLPAPQHKTQARIQLQPHLRSPKSQGKVQSQAQMQQVEGRTSHKSQPNSQINSQPKYMSNKDVLHPNPLQLNSQPHPKPKSKPQYKPQPKYDDQELMEAFLKTEEMITEYKDDGTEGGLERLKSEQARLADELWRSYRGKKEEDLHFQSGAVLTEERNIEHDKKIANLQKLLQEAEQQKLETEEKHEKLQKQIESLAKDSDKFITVWQWERSKDEWISYGEDHQQEFDMWYRVAPKAQFEISFSWTFLYGFFESKTTYKIDFQTMSQVSYEGTRRNIRRKIDVCPQTRAIELDQKIALLERRAKEAEQQKAYAELQKCEAERQTCEAERQKREAERQKSKAQQKAENVARQKAHVEQEHKKLLGEVGPLERRAKEAEQQKAHAERQKLEAERQKCEAERQESKAQQKAENVARQKAHVEQEHKKLLGEVGPVDWQCSCDGLQRQWLSYHTQMQKLLENSKTAKSPIRFSPGFNEYSYDFDFVAMTQTNTETRKVRKIRRHRLGIDLQRDQKMASLEDRVKKAEQQTAHAERQKSDAERQKSEAERQKSEAERQKLKAEQKTKNVARQKAHVEQEHKKLLGELGPVDWQWSCDDLQSQWMSYDAQSQNMLEDYGTEQHPLNFTFGFNEYTYDIDFVAMTQTNAETGKVRKIRRHRSGIAADIDKELHGLLKKWNLETADSVKYFVASAHFGQQSCVVSSVLRVLRKDIPYYPPKDPRNEMVLFHATSAEAALAIQNGSFIPSDGGMLGAGVYLARSPEKAWNYRKGDVDTMLLCLVNIEGAKVRGRGATKEYCVDSARKTRPLYILVF